MDMVEVREEGTDLSGDDAAAGDKISEREVARPNQALIGPRLSL